MGDRESGIANDDTQQSERCAAGAKNEIHSLPRASRNPGQPRENRRDGHVYCHKCYSEPGALIQNAATSQTSALPLVEISETSRLRIYVYVDQAHAPFVRKGDAVTILDQANPGLKLEARVTRTSGEIDAAYTGDPTGRVVTLGLRMKM